MPANVILAALGLFGMAVLLSWETIGLDQAADLLANGPILPAPYDALAIRIYHILRDWQGVIAAGLLLWGLRRWSPFLQQAAPLPRPTEATLPVSDGKEDIRANAIRRLDAGLRQLDFAMEAVKLDIRSSVQDSFMAFQVKAFLALPAPGLEALERDIGQLEPEVIYLFYRLMAKLQAVRAISTECGRKHVIATIEEVEAIMHHLRTAFESAAGGTLLPWQPGLMPRAAESKRRVRQETT